MNKPFNGMEEAYGFIRTSRHALKTIDDLIILERDSTVKDIALKNCQGLALPYGIAIEPTTKKRCIRVAIVTDSTRKTSELQNALSDIMTISRTGTIEFLKQNTTGLEEVSVDNGGIKGNIFELPYHAGIAYDFARIFERIATEQLQQYDTLSPFGLRICIGLYTRMG